MQSGPIWKRCFLFCCNRSSGSSPCVFVFLYCRAKSPCHKAWQGEIAQNCSWKTYFPEAISGNLTQLLSQRVLLAHYKCKIRKRKQAPGLTNPLQCHILFKNKIKKILRGRVTRSDENPIYGKSRPAVKPASRRQDGPDQAKRVWQVIVRSADSVSSLQFRSRQYSLDERGKQNVHDRHGICA